MNDTPKSGCARGHDVLDSMNGQLVKDCGIAMHRIGQMFSMKLHNDAGSIDLD